MENISWNELENIWTIMYEEYNHIHIVMENVMLEQTDHIIFSQN